VVSGAVRLRRGEFDESTRSTTSRPSVARRRSARSSCSSTSQMSYCRSRRRLTSTTFSSASASPRHGRWSARTVTCSLRSALFPRSRNSPPFSSGPFCTTGPTRVQRCASSRSPLGSWPPSGRTASTAGSSASVGICWGTFPSTTRRSHSERHFDEYDSDTPENQLLAAGLDAARQHAKDRDVRFSAVRLKSASHPPLMPIGTREPSATHDETRATGPRTNSPSSSCASSRSTICSTEPGTASRPS
jgi:hypothetical protein